MQTKSKAQNRQTNKPISSWWPPPHVTEYLETQIAREARACPSTRAIQYHPLQRLKTQYNNSDRRNVFLKEKLCRKKKHCVATKYQERKENAGKRMQTKSKAQNRQKDKHTDLKGRLPPPHVTECLGRQTARESRNCHFNKSDPSSNATH
jgi:hypothetical protein